MPADAAGTFAEQSPNSVMSAGMSHDLLMCVAEAMADGAPGP